MATKTETKLRRENAALRVRLEEVEEALRAIGAGDVDALVMGEQVYSLKGAETPYRLLVEAMSEGAATLGEDATILYANRRLAELLRTSLEELLGSSLRRFVAQADVPVFDTLFSNGRQGSVKGELTFYPEGAPAVPVQLSFNVLDMRGTRTVCVVAMDLTERKQVEMAMARRTEEMRQFNLAAVGRELRMIELKQQVNELARQLGQPQAYEMEGLADAVPSSTQGNAQSPLALSSSGMTQRIEGATGDAAGVFLIETEKEQP